MIIAVALLAAKAQTETFNLGKLVTDTITMVDQKYLVLVQDVSKALQHVSQVASQEEKQGNMKNKAAYEKMVNDLTVLLNGYYSDFVDVTINSLYIDVPETTQKLINIRGEITKLNNCADCDSTQKSNQLQLYHFEANKLNRWLKQ